MKFKTYTGITWSILELAGLLEDEDSHVYFERLKKHFGLHPFHLTNLNAALNEILSSNLNLHDAELKGFLLAYKNPKLLTSLGEIFYDTCFIHVDIEADFYIFRPKVGCSLKGIVNKKGIDHIGVLVHKAFNVSIPKMDNDENWPGDNLEIGQEVRFKVTSLDFDSKLPFIRGILNPDDYLQGCKLMEKTSKRTHFNNHRTNDESIASNELETNSKQHRFFATDSENSSDEGVAKVKKETPPVKKSKKKFDKEKPTESIEIKEEDEKHGKKFKRVKESMPEPIKIEETVEQYTNSNTVNGELESDQELKPVLKKRARKKSRDHGSQSSLDEQYNEKSAKSPKSVSKSLCNEESKTKINRIKLEHESSSSELVVEESEPKSKVKSKKHFAKRKLLDETDNSADDFTVEKYITSKKKLKIRSSDCDNVSVKAEESYGANEEVEEISIQKHPKRHKHPIKLEFPESDVDGSSNAEKTSGRRRSRTSSIADSEFAFHDINIKKENPNSSSENTENEDRVKVCKASTEKPDLNTSTNSSNHDTMGDNDTSIKKKRKKHSKKNSLLDSDVIKIEPGFEDIVKVEIFDDDVYTPNKSSTKKKHKFDLNSVTSDTETDLKSNARHSKKKKTSNDEVICQDVKVKKEKFVTNVASEIDEDDVIEKKQSKKLNKSRKFESEFDFSDVQVKTEYCADS
ncbi:DNA-directed RNA polymerase I subunit RPA43-like [Colletes gigas]|uniref:DNA-directed RNA polymerase I subunit RPA43-like n=1 Tax=Colletes gigas TaxID=935657 RepID=UPI001C9B9C0A|nr:DNA-directed RNA polymerase I subunit RPA43-like [Colletes gigas]